MTDIVERLQSSLADRYRIEREIGQGGMAVVYLAHDLRHHRRVAVKVMRPEIAAALGPGRFAREIEIAAQLQHPHILPLYDSGEANGVLYYVMPFVEGESLADRITREGQLPIAEALGIAREVASALGYAHAMGVMHRDIKPKNILLSGGIAVVADFGIARAVSAAGQDRLTEPGLALGTPAYMSPEQVTGASSVDARTDLYSLGAVLYEMLVGEPPHTGPSVQAVIARRLTGDVPDIRTVRETVPLHVEQAVKRALARAPADRFSTATEFVEALDDRRTGEREIERAEATGWTPRRVSIASVGAVLAVAALLVVVRVWGPMGGEPEPIRLLVKPFAGLGPAEDASIADGLAEEIRVRLGRVPGLRPIARQTALQYQNTDRDVRQIGAELNVGYVLDGTIRTHHAAGGDRLRITAELVRASDAEQLWANTFEGTTADVFQLQTDVARQVVEALDIALVESERQALGRTLTSDPEAYHFYLRGNSHDRRLDVAEARLAVQMYERAIALDPGFGAAYAKLSFAHIWMYYLFFDRSNERLAMSRRAADRAAELMGQTPEVHLALGYYYYWGTVDYASAIEQFSVALASDPNDAEVLLAVGVVQRRQGDWTEATATLERAVDVDPRNAVALLNLGQSYRYVRNYAAAERIFRRSVALNPSGFLWALTASVRLSQGDLEGVHAVMREGEGQVGASDMVGALLTITELRPLIPLLQDDLRGALDLLSLEASRSDSVSYYMAKAESRDYRGADVAAAAYYDSARTVLERRLAARPQEARFHGELGIVYAALGRPADAAREAETAAAMLPVTQDAISGATIQYQLAQVYARTGRVEAGAAVLERLCAMPSLVSAEQLAVEPYWSSLRGQPAFRQVCRAR